jgi:phosphatidate cytidylyltransferase
MKRVLTAAALIPLIVYVVLWGPVWLLYAVIAAVCLICYHEYSGIAAAYGFGELGPLGYGAGLLLLAAGNDTLLAVLAAALVTLGLFLRAPDLSKTLPRAALVLLGVVYIFGGFRCAALLHAASPHWLMYALVESWVGDTGAYYVGRRWGRRKLAPAISPAKSWEGAAASAAVAVAVGVLYMRFAMPAIPWWEVVALSIAANAAGQIGDLAESAMKRGAGAKDSGAILPGHGGFLDRVDGTLFTLPAVYLCLRLAEIAR